MLVDPSAAAPAAAPALARSPAAPQPEPQARPDGAVAIASPAGLTALGASAALAACGGGADAPPTPEQAARFLAQASVGADARQIELVQLLGFEAWLDDQFKMARSPSRCDWLVAKGYDLPGTNDANKNGVGGFDACTWGKLMASPDVLRQRVTLALSEILVVGLGGLSGSWRQFSGANYLDILERHAFGNFRALLRDVSTSPAMGEYLTYRGNAKANTRTGALPDENYARELLQLFTIGLVQLELDGTPRLVNGRPQESYGQEDIAGLARVFTGWDWDRTGTGLTTPDFQRRPMVQVATRHETGASSFLGGTVPAGLSGEAALDAALDIIFAHANVAPFVSRQLIQRLVTSNPSPAYVRRVATVFLNDGQGVKGNLQAVVRAILLDAEARDASYAAAPDFGKLREPILRFLAWARAFNATSATDAWAVGDTSDPGTRLGQSPLRSPSVFNFFRPGYVPPNSAIAQEGLVAPEFQLANETSVVGYVNWMQTVVQRGVGDVLPDYSSLLPLAGNAQALVDKLNLLLAAGQLKGTTLATVRTAIEAMPAPTTTTTTSNRIHAAVLLVLAAPEFLVLK